MSSSVEIVAACGLAAQRAAPSLAPHGEPDFVDDADEADEEEDEEDRKRVVCN